VIGYKPFFYTGARSNGSRVSCPRKQQYVAEIPNLASNLESHDHQANALAGCYCLPVMPLNFYCGFSFWYYMHSKDMKRFRLFYHDLMSCTSFSIFGLL